MAVKITREQHSTIEVAIRALLNALGHEPVGVYVGRSNGELFFDATFVRRGSKALDTLRVTLTAPERKESMDL